MPAAVQTTANAPWATGSTDTIINKPSGTVDGGLLIAFLYENGTATMSSAPAGWTDIGTNPVASGQGERFYAYSKIASGEPASWTWNWNTTSGQKGGVVLLITGHDPTTPINANNAATAVNTAAPSYANGITPSVANCLLMMLVNARQNASDIAGYAIATNNPATWTEQYQDGPTSSSIAAVATATRPETTATGNSSVSGMDATADSGCLLIAIAPAASGALPLPVFTRQAVKRAAHY